MKKRTVLLLILGIVIIIGGIALKVFLPTKQLVTVVSYDSSTCSQVVPSTNCDGYAVVARLQNGSKQTYQAPGYKNSDSTTYDKIRSVIIGSQQHSKAVTLTLKDRQITGATY